MATAASPALEKKMSRSPGKLGMLVFGAALVVGVIYTGVSIASDMGTVHSTSIFPFLLLGVALLTALGFEFVNGFHDTANAVATVIYTHSLEPHIAVVLSGVCNFLGVLALGRRGGVRDYLAAAGRTDSAGGQRGRVCDGVRAVDRGYPVESRDLVFRLAGVEFAHDGRVDHRRGYRESADVADIGHERGGLGPGEEDRREPADFSADRFWCYRRSFCCSRRC